MILLLALGTSVVGCSGDDDTTDPGTTDLSTTSATASSSTTPSETTTSETATSTTTSDTTSSTASSSTTTASSSTAPGATPDAAPQPLRPVGPGPYAVGVQTITVTDAERDRELTVDVWFPLPAGTEGDAHRYTLVPGTYYESPRAITARAAAMAPDGPYPLVVYSHGSGGLRYLHSNYTEAIAGHGYVVAAPDHTGNTALERITDTSDPFRKIELDRPQDVAAVIDALTDPAHPTAGPFAANVDAASIAVTGHSFGGYTTYAMASGARNRRGSFAADARVDALIPLAPATGDGTGNRLLSDAELASITLPALVIVGTDDRTTPVDPNVTRPWELSASDPQYRLELVDAEHQTFTDICDYQDAVPRLPDVLPVIVETIDAFAEEGCAPDDMPIERATALTNTFAVTFLDSVFRDGEMITPQNTVIPDDVNYLVR